MMVMSEQCDNNMSHEEGQPEGVREGHQRGCQAGSPEVTATGVRCLRWVVRKAI